eukprot:TRINITY_DN37300_c0_g1_i1.p1 TRINITY_DN37300_c0_g1~~TRINITY_DN37300_c0_g1_i1.p1  ORF type:complete len:953 (+),score=192.15 TRINITY_DN37300_c0_g1_i1:45-2861(+)
MAAALEPLAASPAAAVIADASRGIKRHGAALKKLRSTGALDAVPAQLPPIRAAASRPLSFDDVFFMARRRVAKRAAEKRKGGPHLGRRSCAELSTLMSSVLTGNGSLGEWPSLMSSPSESSSRRNSRPGTATQDKAPRAAPDKRTAAAADSLTTEKQDVVSPRPRKSLPGGRGGHRTSNVVAVKLQPKDRSRQNGDLMEILDGAGVNDVVNRITKKTFDEYDLEVLKQTFYAHKPKGSSDVTLEKIEEILQGFGYLQVSSELVRTVALPITKFEVMDLHEYTLFMKAYAEQERAQVKNAFDAQLEGDKNTLQIDDARSFFAALGFEPMRATLRALVELLPVDNGELHFEQATRLIVMHRDAEGFSHAEVNELYTVFTRFSVPSSVPDVAWRELPLQNLFDALLYAFGGQSLAAARTLSDKAGKAKEPQSEKGSFSFREFLSWARRMRESELQDYRQAFQSFDSDGNGMMSRDELVEMMRSLGYTPLKGPLIESLSQVTDDIEKELDFDDFLNLMIIFRKSDGFTHKEHADLLAAFQSFDELGHGELAIPVLMDVLQYLGYATNADLARRLVKKVDFNDSGAVDEQEFMRLMRLLREEELQAARQVFDKEATDKKRSKIARDALSSALRQLSYKPTDETLEAILKSAGRVRNLDFDFFVGAVDRCREAQVDWWRRHAGYAKHRVEELLDAFNAYDDNKNGTIEQAELVSLINDLGIPMKTVEDQRHFLNLLAVARKRAMRAGLTEAEVGKLKSPEVTFPCFLHFSRALQKQEDEEDVARQRKLIEQANFSDEELQQFENIFDSWVRSIRNEKRKSEEITEQDEAVVEECADGDTKKACDDAQPKLAQGNARNMQSLAARIGDLQHDYLNFAGVRQVLQSLGLSVDSKSQETLQSKVDQLSGRDAGRLDFAGFVRLMRWMLDEDFVGIRSTSAVAKKSVD